MSEDKRWLLPVGIEEALPPVAANVERLRRRVLDLFSSWGYDLVTPPLIEYLESLLITGDESLALQTMKLVDQLNGRMMGVRADMTPQVARIDAHTLTGRPINRLCYAGTILKARLDRVQGTRAPLQFGAEIYGDAGAESDVEIIRLMLASLEAVGVRDVYIDLGHVGICSALAAAAGFDESQEKAFSALLNSKAAHEMQDYLDAQGVSGETRTKLLALPGLNGSPEVLARARELFGDVAGVGKALDELAVISSRLTAAGIEPHYDLAELRGYHYKTGVVFAAFTPGFGQEIARGGRYDGIGKVFGRSRPAVGFSGDLRLLAEIVVESTAAAKRGIFAPRPESEEAAGGLNDAIFELRAAGERVVQRLSERDEPTSLGCDRHLVLENDRWVVKEL